MLYTRRPFVTSLLVCSAAVLADQPLTAQQPAPSAVTSPLEQKKKDAEEAYGRGAYPTTIQLTNEVLRQAPNDDVALYLRGSARVENGLQTGDSDMLRAGIADAREAIRLGGGDHSMYYLPYLYGMTNLSIIEGREDHANVSVQISDTALANPNLTPEEKANLTYQRGLAKRAMKKLDTAATDFETALRLNPKLLAAYTADAETLAQAGQLDRAKAAFDRTVQGFPQNPLVYNERGRFLQQTGKLDEAVADFTRAIELDPNFYISYFNRGYTLMLKDDLQAAETDFTSALRIRNDQPMLYGLRGTARLRQRKTAEAIADHRKAVELDPNSSVTHTDLAFTYFFSKQYAPALQEFTKAVELNPNFRHLEPWRVASMEELGQQQQAETAYATALAQPKDKWSWIDHLLAFQLGRETAEQLKSVVSAQEPAKSAQLCEAEYFIGRSLARQGKQNEAQNAYRQAVQTKARHLSAYRGAEMSLGQN